MSNEDRTEYEREAYQRGADAALNAASWVVDGNTKRDLIPALLKMIDDGDPAMEAYLPAEPNLSGEWADDLTPTRLYEEITGRDHSESEADAGLGYETLVGRELDAIANAFEEGVSDTFMTEIERILRAAIT